MSRFIARLKRQANKLILTLRKAVFRRFKLHLTIEGYCLVTAMLLIGMAALNTGAPLLYLMFSMMCSFFILSALLATNTIRNLEVTREVPRVWSAAKPLPVVLRVKNVKRLTSSYSLRLNDRMSDDALAGAVFFDRVAPMGRGSTQEYQIVFPLRGVHNFATVDVATRFPFGLIERVLTYELPEEILILPQVVSVDRAMEAARSELGDFESNRKGPGTGLYGLREYTPDMPARDIHWKLSARRGVLIAREYESEVKRRATVLIDNRIPASKRGELKLRFEKAIVLAASVVDWLMRHDHEVELRTASGVVGFGIGSAHMIRVRRALALLEMVESTPDNSRYIQGSEAGVAQLIIQLGGNEQLPPGARLLRTDDFAPELKEAFQAPMLIASGRRRGVES